MRVFKTRMFEKWARSERLSDGVLRRSVSEIADGLVDARLGGSVFKKRIAIGGRGKSSGLRTIVAFSRGSHVFFIYGFSKSERANVRTDELKALKAYAKVLLGYGSSDLAKLVKANKLVEVKYYE